MKLVIAHLYPREMNIYGDLGNIITLQKRLEWRGFEVEVRPVEVGQEFDFSQADILFGGGGQDRGQLLVAQDLQEKGEAIRQAAADGLPMLLICGLYQLFGHGFTTASGQELPGIGVFDAHTIGSGVRMIGNIVLDSPWGRLVGFENHSGSTTLTKGQNALGKVLKGYGNQPKGHFEGGVSHNAVGTYLHGPVLPKNPALADYLISEALKRKGITDPLKQLDDQLELQSASVAARRPR
jgi:CobQ-like glutamine amidotransferase family enzyme